MFFNFKLFYSIYMFVIHFKLSQKPNYFFNKVRNNTSFT